MRKIITALLLFLAVKSGYTQSIAVSDGINMPGNWNGWTNPPTKAAFANDSQSATGKIRLVSSHQAYYHTLFYIDTTVTADTTAGNYEFNFTSGPVSNYNQYVWNEVQVVMDSIQNYTLGGSNANTISLRNNSWYTANFEEKGYNNSRAVFMQTSRKPVSIDSITLLSAYIPSSQSPVVSIYLSDSICAEEHIFLLYTTDGWITSNTVLANVNGKIATATIPSLSVGDTVIYDAFSSVKSNISGDVGLWTLNEYQSEHQYIVTDHLIQFNYFSDSSICQGASLAIGYISKVTLNPTNRISIIVSDSSGLFTSTQTIYSDYHNKKTDTLHISIPKTLNPGNNYQIKLICDLPADTSAANNFSISINPKVTIVLGNASSIQICTGDSAKLTEVSGAGYQYQWRKNFQNITGATDSFYFAKDSATYDLLATNSCGTDSSVSIMVLVSALPKATLSAVGQTSICYGDSTPLVLSAITGNKVRWFLGNTPVITAATDTFFTKIAGDYTAEISDTSTGCKGFTNQITITYSSCSHINASEGINLPGSWNNWVSPPANKKSLASAAQVSGGKVRNIQAQINRYQTLLHIDSINADTSTGNYNFQFTSGPTNNFSANKWGNVNTVLDSLQSYLYNSNTNNTIAVTNGNWYTINFEDKGYTNSRAIFMKTSSKPAYIDSSQQSPKFVYFNKPVQVSFNLDSLPSKEEIFYLRYSADNWFTSNLIKATVIGKSGSAVIPQTNKMDTICYYLFSSTKQNIADDYDLYTINVNNNSGQNYTYFSQNLSISIKSVNLTTVCSGSDLSIEYDCGSFNSNNKFTIQLSDQNGNFNKNAIDLLTFQDSVSGKVIVTIPLYTPTGKGYRLRVNGDSPNIVGLPNDSDITIYQSPGDSLQLLGSPNICSGDSVFIFSNYTNGYKYIWYKDGNVINLAKDSGIWVKTDGTYNAEISDSMSCSTMSQKITIQTTANSPTAQINALGSVQFCDGGQVTLKCNTDKSYSYQWRYNFSNINGANDTTTVANQTGSYDVVITNSCGSVTSSPITINVYPYPVVKVDSASICSGKPAILHATFDSSFTYIWYRNDTLLAASTYDTIHATIGGIYQVITSNPFGCTDTAFGLVSISVTPDASISPADSASFCAGSYILLNSTPGAAFYQWKKNGKIIVGADSSSYQADTAGKYTVYIKSSSGCVSETAKPTVVKINPLPVKPSITKNGRVLSSSSANQYLWLLNGVAIGGAVQQSYTVIIDGAYNVLITDNNGCQNMSDTVFITTGIRNSNNQLFKAKIYPNPASDQFTLLTYTIQNEPIIIYDYKGSVIRILTQLNSLQPNQIDVSDLANGLYFIVSTDFTIPFSILR